MPEPSKLNDLPALLKNSNMCTELQVYVCGYGCVCACVRAYVYVCHGFARLSGPAWQTAITLCTNTHDGVFFFVISPI